MNWIRRRREVTPADVAAYTSQSEEEAAALLIALTAKGYLQEMEQAFAKSRPGAASLSHESAYGRAVRLMRSDAGRGVRRFAGWTDRERIVGRAARIRTATAPAFREYSSVGA